MIVKPVINYLLVKSTLHEQNVWSIVLQMLYRVVKIRSSVGAEDIMLRLDHVVSSLPYSVGASRTSTPAQP